MPIPDTGTLHGDLTQLARAVAAELRSPAGRALLRLAVSASDEVPVCVGGR